MTVGKRLKEERERLGLSQDAFGKSGGVSKGAQINYEKDARAPDADYLVGIDQAGADVLYILIGKRRIDLAVTGQERSLLSQAIRYVMSEGDRDEQATAQAIQLQYDKLYREIGQGGFHPGQALTERDRDLLACFHRANEDGRKVIERIAELESVRAAHASQKESNIRIKGHGNAVGNNISLGDVIVGDSNVTKKR